MDIEKIGDLIFMQYYNPYYHKFLNAELEAEIESLYHLNVSRVSFGGESIHTESTSIDNVVIRVLSLKEVLKNKIEKQAQHRKRLFKILQQYKPDDVRKVEEYFYNQFYQHEIPECKVIEELQFKMSYEEREARLSRHETATDTEHRKVTEQARVDGIQKKKDAEIQRRRKWMMSKELLPVDDPAAVFELPENKLRELVAFCRSLETIQNFNDKHTSYGIKHIFEHYGGYVTNGEFKGAMEIAGFKVKDAHEKNWIFNVSERSIKKVKNEMEENRGGHQYQ